jgi:hypothetical protein
MLIKQAAVSRLLVDPPPPGGMPAKCRAHALPSISPCPIIAESVLDEEPTVFQTPPAAQIALGAGKLASQGLPSRALGQ